jgi:hypothetical protein
MFTGADWVTVGTFVVGAIAASIAAWRTSRKDDIEPPQPAVRLHEDDRTLLARVIDTISRAVTRIEDALAEHRRAVEDNSDHLRRSRKDDR